MKKWMSLAGRLALVVIIVMAMGIYLGCSKESADTATTEDAVKTKEAAGEVAEEMVAYANPEKGVCPVCGMKVAVDHIQVASIDDKKYACCSAGCVAALTEDPDTYLKAEGEKTGHEGHGH